MSHDFSKPQRQSAVGIILMAINTLQKIVRALIAPLVIAIVKFDQKILLYCAITVLIVIIISCLFSYLSYRRFTFYLDLEQQEFVINKGIFNRTQLTVQLDKIQQVNINQNLLQKIIGVYGLHIDTAGSDSQEVSIAAIDEDLAHNLREHLLSGKKIAIGANEVTAEKTLPSDIPLLQVNFFTLLKVGLTSNYGASIALLIAFLYPLYHNAKELLSAFDLEDRVDTVIESLFSLFSLAIIAGVLLLLLLTINIIRTLIKYFDFQISKHQRSLLIAAGLFSRKNTLLGPQKVQITTYSQNYFQKKMNLLNMNLKQAAQGHSPKGEEIKSTNLEIPGCNNWERDEILIMILGKLPQKSTTFIPNWRFLNLPIFFKVILPIVIFFIFWANTPEMHTFYPLPIVYGFIVVPMIYMSYRRHHLRVDQEFIIKKSGIWDIEHEIILPHKIQAITTFQYPWHKGVDVGHVNLHTSAGTIHFKYGNFSEIKKLVNYWLYQIESGSQEWM
jgi:putative membrane protein